MKRQPCSMIRVSKSGGVFCRIAEKLGIGYEVNRRSTKEYEKAV